MAIQTHWRWLKDLQVKKLMCVDIDKFHVRLKVSHERKADVYFLNAECQTIHKLHNRRDAADKEASILPGGRLVTDNCCISGLVER